MAGGIVAWMTVYTATLFFLCSKIVELIVLPVYTAAHLDVIMLLEEVKRELSIGSGTKSK